MAYPETSPHMTAFNTLGTKKNNEQIVYSPIV